MQQLQILKWFLYFCIFLMGLIIGRVTMAVQYETMNPKKDTKLEGNSQK